MLDAACGSSGEESPGLDLTSDFPCSKQGTLKHAPLTVLHAQRVGGLELGCMSFCMSFPSCDRCNSSCESDLVLVELLYLTL